MRTCFHHLFSRMRLNMLNPSHDHESHWNFGTSSLAWLRSGFFGTLGKVWNIPQYRNVPWGGWKKNKRLMAHGWKGSAIWPGNSLFMPIQIGWQINPSAWLAQPQRFLKALFHILKMSFSSDCEVMLVPAGRLTSSFCHFNSYKIA